MSGFSDYWENEIMDHLFDKGVYPAPTIYVALSKADPGDDGAGAMEPVGGSYARIETSNADWTPAASGVISNTGAIEFAQTSLAWGTITHFALYDAAVGGHLLASGPLAAAKTVATGDTLRFPAGGLAITLD